jgi:hypothetical protein
MKIFGNLTFIMNFFFLISLIVIGTVLDLIKQLDIVKDLWHDEIEETPEFSEVITQWSSCQK